MAFSGTFKEKGDGFILGKLKQKPRQLFSYRGFNSLERETGFENCLTNQIYSMKLNNIN
jgi:hypothetical protein